MIVFLLLLIFQSQNGLILTLTKTTNKHSYLKISIPKWSDFNLYLQIDDPEAKIDFNPKMV